jgi:outer membrane protein assembly factor BamD (BamD/ComL family)
MFNLNKLSIFLVFAILAFTISISYSQEKKKNVDPETKANKIAEKIQKKLNLNMDQSSQINKAYLDYFTSLKNFRDTKSDDKAKNMAAIKDIKTNLRTELKKTLDDKQMKKIGRFMRNRRHHGFMKSHDQKSQEQK